MVDLLELLKCAAKKIADALLRPLSPARIVRACAKEAARQSRSWGDNSKREVPNRFTVYIGTEDWGGYYCNRSEAVCSRLERELDLEVRRMDYAMEGYPHVFLERDPEMGRGMVRVEAAFAPAREIPEGSKLKGKPNAAGDDERSGGGRHRNDDKPSAAPGVTPAIEAPDGPCAKTKVLRREDEVACLEGGGVRVRVTPGTTIGTIRRPGEAKPDIVLPGTFSATSQMQGVFLCRHGSWRFENKGRNSVKIQKGGEGCRKVAPAASAEIGSGDAITFPGGEPMIFTAMTSAA